MANDLNKLFLIGRLTKDLGSDPQGRDFGYLQNGTCKGTISVAVNSSKKQGDQYVEEVNYFNIVLWGKTAENLKPYLTKGQQVVVEAHLKQDRWTDQQGNNRSQISINAENIQLLGSKRDNSEQQSQYAQQYQQQQYGTPQFTPSNNGYQNQSQNNGYQNQSMNNQQSGFKEDIPWDSSNDYPSDIPF